MKAHLLFRDRDFDPSSPRPANESDLTADLALAYSALRLAQAAEVR